MTISVRENTAARDRRGRVTHIAGCNMLANIRDFPVIELDEPPIAGGTDKGPTPLELVTTGLAGCKAVTIAKIAEAMDFKIANLHVDAATDVKYRAANSDMGPVPRFTAARLVVSFDSPESQERKELLASYVRERCPASTLFEQAGIPVDVIWPWNE